MPGLEVVQEKPQLELMESKGDKIIEAKFNALGGEQKLGQIDHKEIGRVWYFKGGSCICYNKDTGKAYEIHGSIYRKWLALGGLKFAAPCTDETGTPDGAGRFNHFNHGKSIYWSPGTGANAVYGSIRDKWQALGWEKSYLGYPTTDEIDFEGGRASGFQNGDIYWWEDVGAIDLHGIVIHYTGMYCFDRQDGLGDDSPYAVISVASAGSASTVRTQVYNDMTGGQSRPEAPPMEIYRGKPYALAIDTILMEHGPGGNPDDYRDEVKKAVMAAHTLGTAALGLIPVVGPIIAGIAGPALGQLMPKVGDAIADFFGDKKVGENIHYMRGRELVLLAAREQNHNFEGIGYRFDTRRINGRGGSYTIYYGIVPA
jgi:hypothetical protein